MKIKILLWDVDDTVLSFNAQMVNAMRKCFNVFNLGECGEEMLSYYSKLGEGYWERFNRGEITKEELFICKFEEFFREYGLNCDASKFNKLYQESLGDTIVFNDNSDKLLSELKGNYKQYIVTNGPSITKRKQWNSGGLNKLFDDIFISEEVGSQKPNIEFFNAIFRCLPSCEKEEILLIGDSLSSDIKGANNAGIKSCWYNPNGKSRPKDLKIDYEINDLNDLRKILDI